MSRAELRPRMMAARIIPVFLVFLGASWGVLEVVKILQARFGLPAWVFPASVVLLGIGLVVFLATAWVQALPSTAEKKKAGSVPGEWELAPKDLVESLAGGASPHLNWARSILGGVFALGLMFALAGIAVLFSLI